MKELKLGWAEGEQDLYPSFPLCTHRPTHTTPHVLPCVRERRGPSIRMSYAVHTLDLALHIVLSVVGSSGHGPEYVAECDDAAQEGPNAPW